MKILLSVFLCFLFSRLYSQTTEDFNKSRVIFFEKAIENRLSQQQVRDLLPDKFKPISDIYEKVFDKSYAQSFYWTESYTIENRTMLSDPSLFKIGYKYLGSKMVGDMIQLVYRNCEKKTFIEISYDYLYGSIYCNLIYFPRSTVISFCP